MTYYNETNTCDRCGYNLELGPGHPGRSSWYDKYEIDVDAWMKGEVKYLNM